MSQQPQYVQYNEVPKQEVQYVERTSQPTQGERVQYGHNEQRQSGYQSNTRGSNFEGRGSKYDLYQQRSKNYKYNFFSMMDEPWNRCCEVGSCGSCPGNGCFASRQPKLDWL